MTRKTIKYFVKVLTILLIVQLNAQEKFTFKIIVNKSNTIEAIDIEELQKIFLKKQIKWVDGDLILPVDLNETSKSRDEFTEKVHNKRISAIKAYWQKQIFTGRGVPPPEKSSEKEVLEYVEKNEGAIGYVSSDISIKKYNVKTIIVND